MNSARLYLELLNSADRLDMALADARSANVIDTEESDYTAWQNRLRIAYFEVECAAECYAVALRTYRVATMAELVPSDPAPPRRSEKIVKRRKRARSMAAVCGNGRDHGKRNGRKDVGAERFPASATLSKLQ